MSQNLHLACEEGNQDYWDEKLEAACFRGNKDLALLMIEKGANINLCEINLTDENIMRLVKAGVNSFGKYRKVAEICKVLNELHIFPDFARLIIELL